MFRSMAPVSGAIFIAANRLLGNCPSATNWPVRQSEAKTICTVAYHIQEYLKAHAKKCERTLGDRPCSPQGTAKRDVAEDGQCMHASLFLRIAIYHWPKGADAAPTGP